MEFIETLETLKMKYGNNNLVRNNGTILLGPEKIPKCRHMLFRPLSEKMINAYLVAEYANEFPKEYIEFLKYSNGANLYSVRLKTEKFSIAHPMMVIFGLPLTPPFGRPLDMEEPYDLRVEDLARHADIPTSWLKCGTYIREYNFKLTYDIFIDTKTKRIFSTEKNKNTVIESWENLDECFSCIYTRLLDSKSEYKY